MIDGVGEEKVAHHSFILQMLEMREEPLPSRLIRCHSLPSPILSRESHVRECDSP